MDWKEEWEKAQENQRGTNKLMAVLFGLFALPWWFKSVEVGLFFTAFWGFMFLVIVLSQPHSYEDYKANLERAAAQREQELQQDIQKLNTYIPDKKTPSCPDCGSSDTVEITNFEKAVAYESWGVGGLNVVDSKYRCCNCGKMWK